MLTILPLKLLLRSETLKLNIFAGQLWRSGLGLSLSEAFPLVFTQLFGESAQQGRLYALETPSQVIAPGEEFTLGIKLFGPACAHAMACVQAIARLGEIGLGENRMRFMLIAASVDGNPPFFSVDRGIEDWPKATSAQALLTAENSPANALEVEFTSPLRIKENNRPYFGELSFSMLIRRIYGRLAQLCEEAGQANPLSRADYQMLLLGADRVSLVTGESMNKTSIRRRSSRTGNTMDFEGLLGKCRYQGDLSPYLGLLRLAEVMQLGGKTTFGFGCLNLKMR